jgi:hypothetical protein
MQHARPDPMVFTLVIDTMMSAAAFGSHACFYRFYMNILFDIF